MIAHQSVQLPARHGKLPGGNITRSYFYEVKRIIMVTTMLAARYLQSAGHTIAWQGIWNAAVI